MGVQILAVLATMVYSFVVTRILLYIVKAIMGLRIDEDEETAGADTSCHGETAYNL